MKSAIAVLSVILALITSGCGLKQVQKDQVASFAVSTETIATHAQTEFKSTRDKTIDLEASRVAITTNKDLKDVDAAFSVDLVLQAIETFGLIKDYGSVLKKLSTEDQSDELAASAKNLLTKYEGFKSIGGDEYKLTDDKKKAAEGVITMAGTWYVEQQKKKALVSIVQAYAPDIDKIAKLGRKQFEINLKGCEIPIGRVAKPAVLSIYDIYCTSLDRSEMAAKGVLNNDSAGFDQKESASKLLVKAKQGKHDVQALSVKSLSAIDAFITANNDLLKVIERDTYHSKDFDVFFAKLNELGKYIGVLSK